MNLVTSNRYMYWEILDEMPEGWVIDKYSTWIGGGLVFITNGKSPISGKQKRAVMRAVCRVDLVSVKMKNPVEANSN